MGSRLCSAARSLHVQSREREACSRPGSHIPDPPGAPERGLTCAVGKVAAAAPHKRIAWIRAWDWAQRVGLVSACEGVSNGAAQWGLVVVVVVCVWGGGGVCGRIVPGWT